MLGVLKYREAEQTLRVIDAIVLSGYDLAPRVERELLDYFNGQERVVPFQFGAYFPPDFEPCYSLRDYLSKGFSKRTASELRKRFVQPPDDVLKALAHAAGRDE